MAQFATMTNLDVWYSRLDAQGVLDRWRSQVSPDDVKRFERTAAKARAQGQPQGAVAAHAAGRWRVPDRQRPADAGAGDRSRRRHRPEPFLAWLHERYRAYRRSLQHDRRHLLEGYRLVDFARKVVGVGSVGTRCWIALLLGKDDADPLFLQVKEAEASVLEPYAGKSSFANHGQRVVEGQRLLQSAGDILLGWTRAEGIDGVERDFYVRQLWDWKVSPALER